MLDGKMEGMFLMGQNPAVGATEFAACNEKRFRKLKWLVVRELGRESNPRTSGANHLRLSAAS